MRSIQEIVRDNGGDNTPMLDTHNLTGRVAKRPLSWTIDGPISESMGGRFEEVGPQCWMVLNGWDDGHLEEPECRALRGYNDCSVHGPAGYVPTIPAKLTGPEIGTLCIYNSRYPRLNGRVVRVLERSYVWAPGDKAYKGGVRRYDWSVIEYGKGKTLCVNDSDLTPLEVGAVVQMQQNDPFYPTGTDW